MKRNIKNKLIVGFFVAIIAFSPFFNYRASADCGTIDYTGINPISLGKCVINDLKEVFGYDTSDTSTIDSAKSEIETNKENLGTSVSADAKLSAKGPQVDIIFDKISIKNGDKVIASALTTNFIDPANKLYFTWYLKQRGCELGSSGNIARCDQDGDSKITVNDWKIKAAKILVRGSYEAGDSNEQLAEDGDVDDGYKASFGGDGKAIYDSDGDVINTARCYVEDYKSGRAYELTNIKESNENTCPAGYEPGCVQDLIPDLNCEVKNPAYNQADADAAAENGQPYDVPQTKIVTRKSCQQQDYDNQPQCKVIDVESFKARFQCSDSSERFVCVKSTGDTTVKDKNNADLGVMFNKSTSQSSMCSLLAPYETGGSGTETGDSCSDILDNANFDKNSLISSCTFVLNKPDDYDDEHPKYLYPQYTKGNLCKHLFPDTGKKGFYAGDGKFSTTEEEFWGTDIRNKSTAGNGHVDEQNIVGLGAEKFSWSYTTGDMLGVVVEGTSTFPTDHNDSSSKIMWALPKNSCNASSSSNEDTIDRGYYQEDVNGTPTGFLAANFDMNECLEENLLDPAAGAVNYMDVDLTYSPQNPVNDPENDPDNPVTSRGDKLNLKVAATGDVNISQFYYSWEIAISDNATPSSDRWIIVPKEDLPQHTKMQGIGADSFSFLLNLPRSLFTQENSAVQYIRARVKAQEQSNSGEGKTGVATVIIKVQQVDKDVIVHKVKVEDGQLKFAEAPNDTFCGNSNQVDGCSVVKNDILGLTLSSPASLSNVSWKVNGVETECYERVSSECTSRKDALFLPVLGEPGERIEVIVKAKDSTKNEIVEIKKEFVIAKPVLKIVSDDADKAWSKITGYTDKDLNGEPEEIKSKDVFQTEPDTNVRLKTNVVSEDGQDLRYFESKVNTTWYINGEKKVSPENGDKYISFNSGSKVGESFDVEVRGFYEHPIAIRKALYDYWNISAANSAGEELESSAQINVIKPQGNITALNKPKQFFANILSDAPKQALFFLRIMLSMGVLLLVSGVVFALIPAPIESKEKE